MLFSLKKSQEKKDILESERLYQQGIVTVRSFIAPAAFKINPTSIQIGDVLSRTIFVITYPKFLGSGWFSPIVNIDFSLDIAMFIHPMDTGEILKNLRNTATQIMSQISIEQKAGKIRDPLLESALKNVEDLRDRLLEGTERFFHFGLYMTLYAKNLEELDSLTNRIQAILEAQMIYVKPAVLRMDQGFLSSLPLGDDKLDLANNLNTSPLSTTFPFVSSELSSNEGVLYGINRHNNSLILFDRFEMENANMVVFAASGSGKSYAVKLEILRSLMMGTHVRVIDPENEYKHLCETVGGSYIPISLNSKYHLNPFDLPRLGRDADIEEVFRSHIATLLGLLHLMLGTTTPEEDSMLDRALRETYAVRDITMESHLESVTSENVPTFSDLYEVLQSMEGVESLSARLEKYTEGVFSGFLNKRTNIKTNEQIVVYNIRDLENELRPIAMYVVLQSVWNEMRSELKKRLLVVDEAWIMMQNEDAASFMFSIAKRCRKYYTGLTTITQDVSDFMSSRYGKPIVSNASLQLLLRQSQSSINVLGDTFNLTEQEKFLLLECHVGEGIFFAGMKHVAIRVVASLSEDQMITTDPRQILEIEKAKKELMGEW